MTACRPGPITVSTMLRHQVTIESPTSSTEVRKIAVAHLPHWPAEWNGIG